MLAVDELSQMLVQQKHKLYGKDVSIIWYMEVV